jgi:hypothetical protein
MSEASPIESALPLQDLIKITHFSVKCIALHVFGMNLFVTSARSAALIKLFSGVGSIIELIVEITVVMLFATRSEVSASTLV